MVTKLTLSISARTIAKAKKYARKKGTSVSRIFEDHISALTEQGQSNGSDPIESLKKLKGIAKQAVRRNTNDQDLITDILIGKHLK